MRDKRSVGRKYEEIAANYLRSIGYKIICMNYTARYGEIDIIAEDSGTTVFVEVKYRASSAYGSPAEAVSLSKRRRILAAARCFAAANHLYDSSLRFDVIEFSGRKMRHTADAFFAEGSL